jgi:hypothetical protein
MQLIDGQSGLGQVLFCTLHDHHLDQVQVKCECIKSYIYYHYTWLVDCYAIDRSTITIRSSAFLYLARPPLGSNTSQMRMHKIIHILSLDIVIRLLCN